jgi:hypothetical protein
MCKKCGDTLDHLFLRVVETGFSGFWRRMGQTSGGALGMLEK